jgi:hypothetical protein
MAAARAHFLVTATGLHDGVGTGRAQESTCSTGAAVEPGPGKKSRRDANIGRPN